MTGTKRPLPKGWLELPIAEVADVSLGKTPKKSHYTNEGKIRLIKFRDVIEDKLDLSETKDAFVRDEPAAIKDLRPVQKGDVLLTASAHSPEYIGRKIAIIDELPEGCDYFYVGELLNIRPHDGVDPRWIAAYLRSEQGYKNIQAHVHGMHLTNGRAQNVPIRIAPLKYMQTAVQAIEVLQARSRRAREALAEVGPLLEQLRQSVLAAAFRGDLTANWRAAHPNVEPASELLHRIRAERRRRWEQAELAGYEAKGQKPAKNWQDKYEEPEPVDDFDLPELPDGWAWATVEEISSHIVDCPHSTPKWTGKGKLCVRTTEFRPGQLDLANARFVSQETFDERIQRLKPQPGDVLYSREGGILGISCQVPADTELCLGQRMMLMRTDVHFLNRLLMHWLNSPRTLDRVKRLTLGSASPHLNVGDVKRFPVPVAPLDEQSKLLEQIEIGLATPEICGQMVTDYDQQLDQLDQAILAKAFRGELVPQDPSDEPASALLARIREQRAQQVETARRNKKTSQPQWRNKTGKKSSRLTPQQLTLAEVL